MIPQFEYHTEYLPLTYHTQKRGFLLFQSPNPRTEPDVATFLSSAGTRRRMDELGRAGWELVSVQPALRGEPVVSGQTAQGNLPWALAYTLPSGYLMFFKRVHQAPAPDHLSDTVD